MKALISLGANVALTGRSLTEMLGSALDLVAEANGITIHSRSRWFRTPAFPPGSGPDFVNGAAMLETALDPETVLAALHGAEAELGRVRPVRWAPRVCDLDLIAIEDTVLPDRATLERWMAIDLGQAQTVAPPRLIRLLSASSARAPARAAATAAYIPAPPAPTMKTSVDTRIIFALTRSV